MPTAAAEARAIAPELIETGHQAAQGVLFAGLPITELTRDELLAAAGFLYLELRDMQQRVVVAAQVLMGPDPEETETGELDLLELLLAEGNE